jgi:hypothetical protein
MNDAATSIWAAAAVAFTWMFLVLDYSFTLNNVMYWWAPVVTLRLVTVETVRYVMLRKHGAHK